MATIECPHCHTRFELKSSDYQEILSQVRTSEFEREIHERRAGTGPDAGSPPSASPVG